MGQDFLVLTKDLRCSNERELSKFFFNIKTEFKTSSSSFRDILFKDVTQ